MHNFQKESSLINKDYTSILQFQKMYKKLSLWIRMPLEVKTDHLCGSLTISVCGMFLFSKIFSIPKEAKRT